MARSKYLDPRAKAVIIEQIHNKGEMDKEAIKDLIRPHFMFDVAAAREQAINKVANQIISQIRDETGTRSCFVLRGQDIVVDLDTCSDYHKVKRVQKALEKQILGTVRSYKKASKRAEELKGQLSLFALTEELQYPNAANA